MGAELQGIAAMMRCCDADKRGAARGIPSHQFEDRCLADLGALVADDCWTVRGQLVQGS